MDTSGENTAPEGTTIKRMIDRFRHASPKSREERAAIDAQARPDFWWKKTARPAGPTDSGPRTGELASSGGEPSQAVDLRASFASYLGDTAPLQASSRYNVSVAAAPPVGAEEELLVWAERLFERASAAAVASAEPASTAAPAPAAAQPPAASQPSRALPASASIVAEDLEQALASFKSRYRDRGASVGSEGSALDGGGGGAEEGGAEGEGGAAGTSRQLFSFNHGYSSDIDTPSWTTGGAGGGLDVSALRASLSRAHALTAALGATGASAGTTAGRRPPSGRTGGSGGAPAAPVQAQEEAPGESRRRLSATLSSLGEALDVSMLTMSRRLALLSGDPGLLLEAGVGLLPSAAEVEVAARAREGAGFERLQPVSASAAASLRASLDAGEASGVVALPILADEGSPQAEPGAPPMSPDQRRTLDELRKSWSEEAVKARAGTQAAPAPPAVEAAAPAPAADAAAASAAEAAVAPEAAPAPVQPSILALYAAAMAGDVAAVSAALAKAPRAPRLGLSLEPNGTLSSETLAGMTARRAGSVVAQAAGPAVSVVAAEGAAVPAAAAAVAVVPFVAPTAVEAVAVPAPAPAAVSAPASAVPLPSPPPPVPSSFIPLATFLPPVAPLPLKAMPAGAGEAGRAFLQSMSAEASRGGPSLSASFSLPSPWGRPSALVGSSDELSPLQAQAMEAALGYGYQGGLGGGAGMGAPPTLGHPAWEGYSYAPPPPRVVQPPSAPAPAPQPLPPGTVAIPLELAPAFAAFLRSQTDRGVELGRALAASSTAAPLPAAAAAQAPMRASGSWPGVALPPPVSLPLGLPVSSSYPRLFQAHIAAFAPATDLGPASSSPSAVSRHADALAATHVELARRSEGQGGLADAGGLRSNTMRRAEEALAASARLRAMLGGRVSPAGSGDYSVDGSGSARTELSGGAAQEQGRAGYVDLSGFAS